MKIKLSLLIVLACILFYSCNFIKESDNGSKSDIVIIVDKIPDNHKLKLGKFCSGFRGSWEIMANIDLYNQKYFYPDYKIKDTFIVKNIKHSVEIIHKYKAYSLLSFIAQPNDTLEISYTNNLPTVRSRKQCRKFDYNYEFHVRKNLYNYKFSDEEKLRFIGSLYYTYPEYKDLSLIEFHKLYRKEFKFMKLPCQKRSYNKALAQISREKILLDSLINNDLISFDIGKYYKNKILCREKTLKLLFHNEWSFENIKQNDTLIRYDYYKWFLFSIYLKTIFRDVNFVNTSTPIYKELVPSILNNKLLSSGTKEFLSYKCMNKIVDQLYTEKIKYYFNIFDKRFELDSTYRSKIIKIFKIDKNLVNDLSLKRYNGKQISFKELLDNYKGKLIYVDFWASWCAPCRELIPYSHRLEKMYSDKDLIFVYLAFNDDVDNWKRISKKLDLINSRHSYFIMNSKNSSIINDLKLNTIPRFLLYDKKGKLINRNFLRPNSKQINNILHEYLNKL